MITKRLNELTDAFILSTADIQDIATKFKGEMSPGTTGNSSLKMLRTFLTKPQGGEKGAFLAIDFGGTHIRVQLVKLLGAGAFQIKENCTIRLKDLETGYDFTAKDATAAELFNFIATNLAPFATPKQTYALGHTFSFPCSQLSVNQAVLLQWTKEIQTTGVEGQEITSLLEKALTDYHLDQIKPVTILNDTTAILMTASYIDPRSDIGSICGTGHNTCYLEPLESSTQAPMIINLESGNFNCFPRLSYDIALDQSSEKPGQQHLEKATSGHYVGEIARLVILDLAEKGHLFSGNPPSALLLPYELKAQHLALMLQDHTPELHNIWEWLTHTWQIQHSTIEERSALQTIASLVTTRSAQLIAATYAGILLYLDPQLSREHVIGVDGSMFEKMPAYVDTIHTVFEKLYPNQANQILLRLIKDGSGVGAAIAAATCL